MDDYIGKATVFVERRCQCCMDVVKLLDSYDYEVAMREEKQMNSVHKRLANNFESFPKVFINNVFIGGSDDTKQFLDKIDFQQFTTDAKSSVIPHYFVMTDQDCQFCVRKKMDMGWSNDDQDSSTIYDEIDRKTMVYTTTGFTRPQWADSLDIEFFPSYFVFNKYKQEWERINILEKIPPKWSPNPVSFFSRMES